MSVAREQEHNQDLKRIYKREYEFTNSSLLPDALHSNCDLTFTTLALVLNAVRKSF